MVSQLLFEGFLDIKVPRGNSDRKLWKAWHKQWITFSIVHPSGNRELLLQLEFAPKKPSTPTQQICISREGLSVVRCKSKSRPHRTWAIVTSFKPLLFFAAESEAQAQEGMQALRNGLWPPSFSFQMLTACSYEVSLIDDENTFEWGLVGVYGRFVSTFHTISLMHPHWDSTLLQIPLTNVQRLFLVREDKTSSAGVFQIIFKDEEDVKSLQFYCEKVAAAIQWIYNKMIVEGIDKNFTDATTELRTEGEILYENVQTEHLTPGSDRKDRCLETETNQNKNVSLESEMKRECKVYDEQDGSLEYTLLGLDKGLSVDKCKSNYLTTSIVEENTSYINTLQGFDENSPIYENGAFVHKNDMTDNTTVYAEVNKISKKQYFKQKTFIPDLNCDTSVQNDILDTKKNQEHSENFKHNEIDSLFKTKMDLAIQGEFFLNKEVQNSEEEKFQPTISNNLTNKRHSEKENFFLDFQQSSQQLIFDTSPSSEFKQLTAESSFSSDKHDYPDSSREYSTDITALQKEFLDLDNQAEISKPEWNDEDQNDDQEFTNHIYEHLLERKGTIYEEIDDEDDQEREITLQPPDLPERPSNLELPSGLYKLSKNINQVLDEITTQPTSAIKHRTLPKLVGKIKETGRIMHI